GAAVVDVAALLQLADQRTAATRTMDEPGEYVPVLANLRAQGMALVQDLLHTVPELPADDRRVRAPVKLAGPFEFTAVHPLPEQLVGSGGADRPTGLAEVESRLSCHPRHLHYREVATRIPFKQAGHERCALLVEHQGVLA